MTDLRERIARTGEECDSILLVAHNPAVSLLANSLARTGEAADKARLKRGFPPGGVAVFRLAGASWKQLIVEGGALAHFVAPKDVR